MKETHKTYKETGTYDAKENNKSTATVTYKQVHKK